MWLHNSPARQPELGRAGQVQQQPSPIQTPNPEQGKPPAGARLEGQPCIPHPTQLPCICPLPAHIQHGRIPAELHEVLAQLALVFIQDI